MREHLKLVLQHNIKKIANDEGKVAIFVGSKPISIKQCVRQICAEMKARNKTHFDCPINMADDCKF